MKKLDDRRRFLEAALDSTIEGFYSVDTEGNTTSCNAAFLRMLGYTSAEEVVGRKLHDEIHHSHPDGTHYHVEDCPIYRAASTGKGDHIISERFFRKDGTSFPVEYRAQPIFLDGKLLGAICTFVDISDRLKRDSDLLELTTHLNLMLDSAQDYAIISIDPLGQIVTWSQGAERIFGYMPSEALNKPFSTIFTGADRELGAPETELKLAAKNGRASDERWHIRKNGEKFYAAGTLACMRDEHGTIKGYVKICRDRTDQQNTQQALLAARNAAEAANIAKTEFLANMSHEIRTPMNAIIGLSDILSKSEPLTAKQKEFIRTLRTSGDSLLALINDLLDIAKIEARTVELEHIPFNIATIMQQIISMMMVQVKSKGLEFTCDAGVLKNRMFMGDPTRLRQIILNLCGNAIKFTEKGGVYISISSAPTRDAEIENIVIAVRDTGIGMPEETLGKIFHKFIQADTSINRKYGGTGLGLAITKTLTEIMGGTISVKSEVGAGSTFEVTIPLEKAADEMAGRSDYSIEAIAESSVRKEIRPRILLVEDYEANIIVVTTYLEEFGYEFDIARNGNEAFELATTKEYGVALMDVQMHGMNGFEATTLIRKNEQENDRRAIHIIGMTAHALSGDKERCIASGMDDYMSKPFHPDELREKLESAMVAHATVPGFSIPLP